MPLCVLYLAEKILEHLPMHTSHDDNYIQLIVLQWTVEVVMKQKNQITLVI